MTTDRGLFQQRVYHYLSELHDLYAESPIDVRAGVSEPELIQLAQLLADGAIFDLVTQLSDAQRLEEQALHKQLAELRTDQSSERAALRRKHIEERNMLAARPHHLPILHKEQQQELEHLTKRQMKTIRSFTVHIVHALDGRLIEQQSALERSGCSVFTRTTNAQQIRIQMRVLDWIMRLARRPLPPALLATSTTPQSWPA